jgi:hypothetical protein
MSDEPRDRSRRYEAVHRVLELDLPGGRYTIDVTDAAGHVIATYPMSPSNGHVSVGAPQAAE